MFGPKKVEPIKSVEHTPSQGNAQKVSPAQGIVNLAENLGKALGSEMGQPGELLQDTQNPLHLQQSIQNQQPMQEQQIPQQTEEEIPYYYEIVSTAVGQEGNAIYITVRTNNPDIHIGACSLAQ